jgi:hypothetical protein
VHLDAQAEPDLATPAGFLSWALRVIPAQTKLVLGGVVIFAAASLVLGWTRNFSLAATIEIAVIILIFGVLLSAVSAAPARRFGAGGFLTWAVAVLFVGILALMTSSAFFGVPRAGTLIVSMVLRSYEPLTQLASSRPAITVPASATTLLSSLESEVRDEPTASDPRDIIQKLAGKPQLLVQGTLRLASADERRILAVSSLRIDSGTIITNGGDLTIEVNNLSSDNGSIRDFANPQQPRQNAGGLGGGRVTLIVYGTVSGRLSVDMRGQDGAPGSNGTNGSKGPKGARGDNASSGVVDCHRGAGAGGKGGTGTAGTNGGDGYSGGNGGVLIVRSASPERARTLIGDVLVEGGDGGPGGVGGKGGPGGDGGDGGSPVGLCSGGGPNGPPGDPGPDGISGKAGAKGSPGSVRFEPLP